MIISQSGIVDIIPEYNRALRPIFCVSEGDADSRMINITVQNAGNNFNIPEGASVYVAGKKLDGTIFTYECTYSGYIVTFPITEQMSAASGLVLCEIQIVVAGDPLGSANFCFWVEPSPIENGTTSESDLNIFVQAIADLGGYEFLTDEVAVLSARMDQFARLPDGSLSTAADAELVDIRVKANGTTVATAGDAVREQISNVVSAIDSAYDDLDKSVITTAGATKTLTAEAGIYSNTGALRYTQYENLVHYNISVSVGDRYQIKAYSQGDATTPFCVFFDANNDFIGLIPSGDNAVVIKTITVPIGAAVMAINHNTQTQPAYCYEINTVSTKEYIDGIAVKNTEDISVIAPKKYEDVVVIPEGEAGLVNLNGNVQYAQYAQFKHYSFDVSQLQWYKVTLKSQNNTSIPYGIIYDATETIIERLFSENVGQAGAVETHEFSIPQNGVRLVLNNDTTAVALSVYLGNYESVADYVTSTIKSYWNGKKIVWFGTSIPAGVTAAGAADGSGSYPARIGEMLGATMYNESVGSSQVRAGAHGSITTDDQMGYGGCSAVGLMYSLSLSSAEKQEIADNWDSKWKNIITWYGDQVNFANLQAYKNSSWDIKLAKYLSGGSVGQCDLYVFDHGYNDSIRTLGYTDLSDEPATPNDRSYFLGAMRFLFEKILSDNPKAQILIIGHYCTDGRSGNFLTKYVTDAQTKLANIWQYPFIETWKYMGFSHQQITVNGSTTTPAQSWMPDDVHPSSDSTGAALKHYAEVLLPLVDAVR